MVLAGCGQAVGGYDGGWGGDGGWPGGSGGAGAGPGSVVSLGLVAVDAEGNEIGHLLEAEPFRIKVLNVELGIAFELNPATGQVRGLGSSYDFESSDCTGTPYMALPETRCNGNEPIFRNAGTSSFDEDMVLVSAGDAEAEVRSEFLVAVCTPLNEPYPVRCRSRLEATDAIPPAFAPPITLQRR